MKHNESKAEPSCDCPLRGEGYHLGKCSLRDRMGDWHYVPGKPASHYPAYVTHTWIVRRGKGFAECRGCGLRFSDGGNTDDLPVCSTNRTLSLPE